MFLTETVQASITYTIRKVRDEVVDRYIPRFDFCIEPAALSISVPPSKQRC